ncbi:MAG: hypothetical protein M9933_10695 [Chitinophagaceae bacterium]|nr:hypothetical protein [Chitinophagaceae bacterium]
MKRDRNITEHFVKHSFIVIAMFAIAQYVFAVSGIRVKSEIDNKHKESSHASGAFSDLKSTVTFSLKDTYILNNKNLGKANFNLASTEQSAPSSAVSVLTFKKGNTTYILPYKPQAGLKLPGFIKMSPGETPSR